MNKKLTYVTYPAGIQRWNNVDSKSEQKAHLCNLPSWHTALKQRRFKVWAHNVEQRWIYVECTLFYRYVHQDVESTLFQRCVPAGLIPWILKNHIIGRNLLSGPITKTRLFKYEHLQKLKNFR